MSNLIVITFDNEEEAGKVREALKSQSANINLDDSAVVVKDAEGEVHAKNEVRRRRERAPAAGHIGVFCLGLRGQFQRGDGCVEALQGQGHSNVAAPGGRGGAAPRLEPAAAMIDVYSRSKTERS